MKSNNKLIRILVIFTFLLVACSQSPSEKKEKSNETNMDSHPTLGDEKSTEKPDGKNPPDRNQTLNSPGSADGSNGTKDSGSNQPKESIQQTEEKKSPRDNNENSQGSPKSNGSGVESNSAEDASRTIPFAPHDNKVNENNPQKVETPEDLKAKEIAVSIPEDVKAEGGLRQFKFEEFKSRVGEVKVYTRTQESLGQALVAEVESSYESVDFPNIALPRVHVLKMSSEKKLFSVTPKLIIKSFWQSIGHERPSPFGGGGIPLLIALSDGFSDIVSSGIGQAFLSKEGLIENSDLFFRVLKKQFLSSSKEERPIFLGAFPCPNKILLRGASGKDFSIVLRNSGETCVPNQFYAANLQMSIGEWSMLSESLLRSEDVTVTAELDLKAPVITKVHHFSMSKHEVHSKVFSKFKFLMGYPRPLLLNELDLVFSVVIEEILGDFGITLPPENFSTFRDEMVRDLFYYRNTLEKNRMDSRAPVQFMSDLVSPNNPGECPKPYHECFLKSDSNYKGRFYDFFVKTYTFAGVNFPIPVKTRLQLRTQESEPILVISDRKSVLTPPEPVTSKAFATLSEGDMIQLNIEKIGVGHLKASDPMVEVNHRPICLDPFSQCTGGSWSCINQDIENYDCQEICSAGWQDVCTRTESVCVNWDAVGGGGPGRSLLSARNGGIEMLLRSCIQWQNRCVQSQKVCSGWSTVCQQRRVCDRLVPPSGPQLPFRIGTFQSPDPSFVWNCEAIQNGLCDTSQIQDQWITHTKWTSPVLVPDLLIRNMEVSDWERIKDHLSLQFSWPEDSGRETILCPISSFNPKYEWAGDKLRLTLHIRTSKKCPIFEKTRALDSLDPTISFINQSYLKNEFRCGALVETWEGQRTYTCRTTDGRELSSISSIREDEEKTRQGLRIGVWQEFYPRIEIHGTIKRVFPHLESR